MKIFKKNMSICSFSVFRFLSQFDLISEINSYFFSFSLSLSITPVSPLSLMFFLIPIFSHVFFFLFFVFLFCFMFYSLLFYTFLKLVVHSSLHTNPLSPPTLSLSLSLVETLVLILSVKLSNVEPGHG